MSYLTTSRFKRIVTLPLALAQTELRRGKSVCLGAWVLERHQRLEVRGLCIHVVKVLNPGENPTFLSTAMGVASVGLYQGVTMCSPIAHAQVDAVVGATMLNPFAIYRVATPGTYTVWCSNNCDNLDLSVVANGCLKLFL